MAMAERREKLGSRLRRLRIEAGLTQQDLASRAGLSRAGTHTAGGRCSRCPRRKAAVRSSSPFAPAAPGTWRRRAPVELSEL